MDQTTTYYTLGIDIGSTTVKVALLDQDLHIIFSDYERHYANIQETLAGLLKKALNQTGPIDIIPVITGSGGLTLSSHLHVPFVQEVHLLYRGHRPAYERYLRRRNRVFH